MATEPVCAWRAFTRDSGVADEARPVRQGVGARHMARA